MAKVKQAWPLTNEINFGEKEKASMTDVGGYTSGIEACHDTSTIRANF